MLTKYLSIDTEATGLEEDNYLIQFAFVPVDISAKTVRLDLGQEVYVHCPSFEELKPKLNPWVLENNESLIRKAHADGLKPLDFRTFVTQYMESKPITDFFGDSRPVLLGKSLSALDIPIMHRYLSRPFMDKYFHHHTMDVTCLARFFVDCGLLPEGCQSTTKLIQHFKIREGANHTALSDAVDMGNIYIQFHQMFTSLGIKLPAT
jgi:oligoribonuclease (3'-5' exoribonuclease)